LKIFISRWNKLDCTIGMLSCGDFKCFTLELPWRDNETNISCIPAGEYNYAFRSSARNGWVLELKNVPDRTNVQMHSGNFMRNTKGCILVGDSIKHFHRKGKPDVSNSHKTMTRLIAVAGDSGTIKIT
jgi:hypothetical protein